MKHTLIVCFFLAIAHWSYGEVNNQKISVINSSLIFYNPYGGYSDSTIIKDKKVPGRGMARIGRVLTFAGTGFLLMGLSGVGSTSTAEENLVGTGVYMLVPGTILWAVGEKRK